MENALPQYEEGWFLYSIEDELVLPLKPKGEKVTLFSGGRGGGGGGRRASAFVDLPYFLYIVTKRQFCEITLPCESSLSIFCGVRNLSLARIISLHS